MGLWFNHKWRPRGRSWKTPHGMSLSQVKPWPHSPRVTFSWPSTSWKKKVWRVSSGAKCTLKSAVYVKGTWCRGAKASLTTIVINIVIATTQHWFRKTAVPSGLWKATVIGDLDSQVLRCLKKTNGSFRVTWLLTKIGSSHWKRLRAFAHPLIRSSENQGPKSEGGFSKIIAWLWASNLCSATSKNIALNSSYNVRFNLRLTSCVHGLVGLM